jgi:hypothetical protein
MDAKYMEALILLAEMRIRKDTPTLGALCRWVRTLDVVSGLSIHVQVLDQSVVGHNAQNEELIRVLDAILRVTGPTDTTSNGTAANSKPIALQETWNLRPAMEPTRQVRRTVKDKTIFATCSPDLKDCFRIIETTAGLQRKPPNLHPAVLYASQDDAVLLGEGPKTECFKHPIVPNLRLIRDVLSPEECSAIIAAGETIEFIPDAPMRPQGEDTSVLAHNFYWVIDQAFHDKLWSRVKAFVPEVVAGKQVRGINRRFRVYRYVPGAEYRCHIGKLPVQLPSTYANLRRRSMATLRHRPHHRRLPIRLFTLRCAAILPLHLPHLPQRRLQRRRDDVLHPEREGRRHQCISHQAHHGQRSGISAWRSAGCVTARRHWCCRGREVRDSDGCRV